MQIWIFVFNLVLDILRCRMKGYRKGVVFGLLSPGKWLFFIASECFDVTDWNIKSYKRWGDNLPITSLFKEQSTTIGGK